MSPSVVSLAAAVWLLAPSPTRAQAPSTLEAPASPPTGTPGVSERAAAPGEGIVVRTLTEVAPPEEAYTLRYGNRPIVLLRARLLGRTPEERARAAVRRLDELAGQGLAEPVESRVVGGVAVLTVGGQEAVALLPTDLDELAGETLETAGRKAAGNLQRALAEVVEARSPRLLLQGALRALTATVGSLLLAGILWWVRGRFLRRLGAWVIAPLGAHAQGELWRTAEARLLAGVRVAGGLLLLALALGLAYSWLTFVLRQFPYTRPWGEALRGFLVATVLRLGEGALQAIPGLFTVVLILLFTRFLVRLANHLFQAVEEGRLNLPGVFPDTAPSSRRLTVFLLWLLAIVVAYPYFPGSDTDAFKGVSVFVGLLLTLGSSGLVNQMMSSFIITYSRALRLGDFVRVGEVEGTVVFAGLLTTKIRTRRNEEITFPNAVIAASTVTNFSRHAGEGVLMKTSVTIGYDAPWRQVESLLLLAASRTPGLRADPAPCVLQTGLQDFYVEYTLLVAPERPDRRALILSDLHRQVQDAFNEHDVQIMSPHYEADPAAPKLVPRSRWFAPPAKPDQ